MTKFTATIEVEVDKMSIGEASNEIENAQIYGRGGRLLDFEIQNVSRDKGGENDDE